MTYDASFVDRQIIKFDKIITNIRGGYIDDVNNVNYGKFIAAQNGSYQFTVNLISNDKLIRANLVKNGMFIIGPNNGGDGPANLSAILDLKEGDQVYLEKAVLVADDAAYDHYFTSFSGALLRTTL